MFLQKHFAKALSAELRSDLGFNGAQLNPESTTEDKYSRFLTITMSPWTWYFSTMIIFYDFDSNKCRHVSRHIVLSAGKTKSWCCQV